MPFEQCYKMQNWYFGAALAPSCSYRGLYEYICVCTINLFWWSRGRGENVHVPVRIFLKFIIIGISPLFNCDFYVSQQVKIAFINPILW